MVGVQGRSCPVAAGPRAGAAGSAARQADAGHQEPGDRQEVQGGGQTYALGVPRSSKVGVNILTEGEHREHGPPLLGRQVYAY